MERPGSNSMWQKLLFAPQVAKIPPFVSWRGVGVGGRKVSHMLNKHSTLELCVPNPSSSFT